MTTYAIIAAVSYLLGSIPFGYILVRLFLNQDIRATGSGNIGATNVGRTGHKGLAIATLLLDGAKGFVAVRLAGFIVDHKPPTWSGKVAWASGSGDVMLLESFAIAFTLAALFAIVGHLFPVWLRFRGGKGVATGAGAYIALAPKALLVALVVFGLLVAIFRYVSLGSIVATAAFPVALYFLTPLHNFPSAIFLVVISSLLIILRHHQNIGRLLAGTENRLGAKAKVQA